MNRENLKIALACSLLPTLYLFNVVNGLYLKELAVGLLMLEGVGALWMARRSL